MDVPRAAHPLPQHRIDLLAIELGAWLLAGRDKRCVVTESRTELDWAMRQGRISVWAPSKLVRDAVDREEATSLTTRPLALAHWLAERFDAVAVLELGKPRVSEQGPDAGRPVLRLSAEASPEPGWADASTSG